jgi:hypothetical protein
MVSVDDLVISLRIDETSNLGKLQKQLTALVGPKGDKKLDLGGMGGISKGDLSFIKNKLMELSPITLGRENAQVRETVKTTIRQLQRKEIQDMLMAKYGMKKEELESWSIFMAQELKDNESNISDLSGLVREIHMAIFGGEMEGGPQKTSLSNIRKKLPERFMQRTLEGLMKEMGEWFEGQYQIYEIDREKIKKYKSEIANAITEKTEEIEELDVGAVTITTDMIDKMTKLSKTTEDSDEFVNKSLTEIIGLTSANTDIIEEKLKIGATDPILELLALIRSISAETITGMTLIENLKELLPKFEKSLMEPGPARMDVKITKSLVNKLLDKAEEIGIKVHDFGGALDALKDQPETLASELKNIWTKSDVKKDIRHDKRVKETGKDFFVLMGIASTQQGLKELKKEAESSAAKAKYLFLEFLPSLLAKEIDAEEDLDDLLEETNVYEKVDKLAMTLSEVDTSVEKALGETKGDSKDQRRLLEKLYDIIKEIEEDTTSILDNQEVTEREDINYRSEGDPFKL